MKPWLVMFGVAFLFSTIAFASHNDTREERGTGQFEVDFPANSRLRIDSCSGEVRVNGTDQEKIRVHYSGKGSDSTPDVTVRLKRRDQVAELDISGCPHNQFKMTIEIPKTSDLYLRMMAGQLNVEDIPGNKDVELSFGQLDIEMGNPNDYRTVEASVSTGQLEAAPMQVSKGGLFRSFKHEGSGKYRLAAHVGAGQLTLK